MKDLELKNKLRVLLENKKAKTILKSLLLENTPDPSAEKKSNATFTNADLHLANTYGCFKQLQGVRNNLQPINGFSIPGEVAFVKLSTPYKGFDHGFALPPSEKTNNAVTGDLYLTDGNMTKLLLGADGKTPHKFQWECDKIAPTLMNTLSPDAKKAFDAVSKYSGENVKMYTEVINSPDMISQGWVPKTLYDVVDSDKFFKKDASGKNAYADMIKTQYPQLKNIIVWEKGAVRQYQGDRTSEDVKAWAAYGYTEGPCKFEDESFCTQIDLSDCNLNKLKDVNGGQMCKKYTAGQFYVHQNMTGREKQIAEKLKTDADALKSSQYDKDACKKYLQSYVDAYENKVQLNQRLMTDYKYQVDQCTNAKYNFKTLGLFGGLQKKLEGMQYNAKVQSRLGNITDYSLSANAGSATLARESYRDRELKNLIRESLLDIKQTKKKINLGENKIINSRIKLISEHRTLKTKPQKEKFFRELMMEMAHLNSQGYDSQLINENFLDMLKGLFGTAADSTIQYFKESIAKWLIEKLTPMDPNGWMANIIITAVGNVPIGEVSRLTECNYLSDVLTKSIVEGAVNKYKNEKGLTGPFYDILRNGVIEMLEDTKFGQTIEHAIGELVCPMLGGIKDKMSSASDSMKKGALGMS